MIEGFSAIFAIHPFHLFFGGLCHQNLGVGSEKELDACLFKQKCLFSICLFAGELGKLEMLHEGILHKCIKQLLEKKRHTAMADMGEDLECLCQIMRTVGRRLDTDRAKVGFLLVIYL